MAPIVLPSNQPPARFYKGGASISSFRSEPPCDARQPEDWVASTTCCNGCDSSKLGMSKLPDGRFLRDVIEADPEAWLGPEHIKKYGVDTKLLFKLLDAGERLPVHAHPHRDWAKKHVGSKHGKAEAWYILTPGQIHLGLKENVSQEQLLDWVENQNSEELLSRMHCMDVEAHQTVYVPPGMLHALGKGIFVVELQEPEDLSVLLEWKGYAIDGAKDGHLGLGFPTALTAVDDRAWTEEEMEKLLMPAGTFGSTVAKESREYFDLQRIKVSGSETRDSGFAILVVLEGKMSLKTSNGHSTPLKKGHTVVIPHGDGDLILDGEADVLVARPPQ